MQAISMKSFIDQIVLSDSTADATIQMLIVALMKRARPAVTQAAIEEWKKLHVDNDESVDASETRKLFSKV